MKITPSKLAAARLAAAEVFIAEGLEGTNWEDSVEALRSEFETDISVDYEVADGFVSVRVGEVDGNFGVTVDLDFLTDLSIVDAARVPHVLDRALSVARKVEAAIAEAVR